MNKLNSTLPIILVLIMQFLWFGAVSQDKTIGSATKPAIKGVSSKHKIMIIPFENRMYLSEIDFAINKESKLNAKQIKATMRDELNGQLYKKLKQKIDVVDLLDDTTKTKKDLENIYQYLTYQYQKVPSQINYKVPTKEKDSKTIEKGQLVVETNSDARFMNAKIKNATLVPYLSSKYKADLFLFINELDIKSMISSVADFNAEHSRKIIMHYTVYSLDAKEINSGIAEVNFPVSVNNPTKISNSYFSQIADIITTRIIKALEIK